MKTSLLFANQDYKGSPARSRRKVQTHCHLRGNFSCLGEEQSSIKDTKSLADILAGLREKHEKQSPDRTGPKGCPSRKLSSGFSSTKTLRGAKLADSTLGRHLSKSFHVADEDGAQNDGETWHRPRARDASPSLQAGGHHRSRPSMGLMFFC